MSNKKLKSLCNECQLFYVIFQTTNGKEGALALAALSKEKAREIMKEYNKLNSEITHWQFAHIENNLGYISEDVIFPNPFWNVESSEIVH